MTDSENESHLVGIFNNVSSQYRRLNSFGLRVRFGGTLKCPELNISLGMTQGQLTRQNRRERGPNPEGGTA